MRTRENAIRDKSSAFALRIVKLAKYLEGKKREFVLSRQVLRSGTAIGALVREAQHAESKADFTLYWLELLNRGGYISKESFESIRSDSDEVVKLLVAIVKTAKVAKRSE